MEDSKGSFFSAAQGFEFRSTRTDLKYLVVLLISRAFGSYISKCGDIISIKKLRQGDTCPKRVVVFRVRH